MQPRNRTIALISVATVAVLLLSLILVSLLGTLERTRRFSETNRIDLPFGGDQPADALLRAALENLEREVVVRKGSGILMLSFERKQSTPLVASIGESIPVSKEASSLTIGNLPSVVSLLEERLAPSASLTIGTLLQGESQKLFGPHISLTFDFLPLFKEHTTFFMAQTGSGRAWGFGGTSTRDEDRLSQTLMSFHTSRSEAIPPAVETVTLPSGFTQRSIRKNKEGTEIRMSAGWNIWTTREREQAVLLSAQQGHSFLLSTSEELMETMLSTKKLPLPKDRPLLPARAVAGGWLRSDDRRRLLSLLSPSPMKALLEGLEEDVLWSLRATATKVHLVLQYHP